MRIVTYSRYSSDQQDPRSITDQQREMHRFAQAQTQGWIVVGDFADEATSGASLHNRPGVQQALAQARSGAADAILVESVDRLSRNLADVANLAQTLKFWGRKLLTLQDNGEPPWIAMMVKAMVAEQQLHTTAEQVLRGQIGRVLKGAIPGGSAYAYAPIKGEPGKRLIVPEKAEVVRRIFAEFAAGRSAYKIAVGLNKDGIKAPGGGAWNTSTIIGNRKRGTGILNNVMYAGRIQFNKLKYNKNPDSGKRISRLKAKEEVYTHDAPELRIVPAELWEEVQRMRKLARPGPIRDKRRPRRMLSGLVKCECGASYIVVRGDWTGCSAHRNSGVCSNSRMIRMSEVEERVCAALRDKLLAPDVVAGAVEAYRLERERLAKLHAKDRHAIERELGVTRRKHQRAMDAMLNAEDAVTNYTPLISELSRKVQELEAKLPLIEQKVVTLHPRAAERYRSMVENVTSVLERGDAAADEVMQLVRSLIGRIVVHPELGRMGLEVFGDLAVLMGVKPMVNANSACGGCGGRI